MKTSRRDFFKISGVAGTGVLSGSFVCNAKDSVNNSQDIAQEVKKVHKQLFNMSGYAAPKIERVRLGIIGLGMRGPGAVERMSNIEGVDIVGLCDKDMSRVEKAQKILSQHGLPPAKSYGGTPEAWKQMCESPDFDLIYITTPGNFILLLPFMLWNTVNMRFRKFPQR